MLSKNRVFQCTIPACKDNQNAKDKRLGCFPQTKTLWLNFNWRVLLPSGIKKLPV